MPQFPTNDHITTDMQADVTAIGQSAQLPKVDTINARLNDADAKITLVNAVAHERKPVNREKLEYYLARSINIGGYSAMCIPKPEISPVDGKLHSIYAQYGLELMSSNKFIDATWTASHQDIMSGKMFDRYKDILRLIQHVKPKFITDTAFYWFADGVDLNYSFLRVYCVVNDVKKIDPDIVVQASANEYMDWELALSATTNFADCPNNEIPQWVWDAFPLPDGSPRPNEHRQFDFKKMRYNDYLSNNNHWWYDINGDCVPDISKLESQMWFYYIGRRYIDAGCESLNFAQVQKMNEADTSDNDTDQFRKIHDSKYWSIVFDKLRSHAETVPYVRFLLITAGSRGLINWNTGQLAMDFHTLPARPCEHIPAYTPNGGVCTLQKGACDYSSNTEDAWGHSLGGITPSGWYCLHAPIHVVLDNDLYEGSINVWGMAHDVQVHCCNFPYHWDEITWFAMQDKDSRDKWLKYAYYVSRCIDQNAFFILPVKRKLTFLYATYYANDASSRPGAPFTDVPTTIYPFPLSVYPYDHIPVPYRNALLQSDNSGAAFGFGQENAIAEIFTSIPNTPLDWVHHNFTEEQVYDVHNPANYYPIHTGPGTGNALSDLVFVGDDKMFYISTDHRIFGYVKDASKPGVWFPVSPSWSASPQVPLASQASAKSDLVASPDGTMLLYIGADGYLHGFLIHNIYDYSYIDFMMPHMQSQSLKALSDLVFATNTRIYYIAREANGEARIHGFVNDGNTWYGVSPGYAAQVYYGQSMPGQKKPIFGLAYDTNTQRIYYVGENHYLYFFAVHDDWHYEYFACGGNGLLTSNDLIIVSRLSIAGNKIFYVTLQSGQYSRIFCMVDNGNNNNWTQESPTWAVTPAVPFAQQLAPYFGDSLAVSADHFTIAYLGHGNNLAYYNDHGADHYTYGNMISPPANMLPTSSLVFRGNQLFYISSGDKKVHYYSYETSYCKSPYIKQLFPNFTYH